MTARRAVCLLVILVAWVAPAVAQAPAQLRTPDVIFVPTPQEVVDAMLKLAKVDQERRRSTTSALATGASRSRPPRPTARAASASTSTRSASARPTRT